MTVQTEIEQKLVNAFSPIELTVANESHMHSVPENSETHFKVTMVADQFQGQTKVKRHQSVYGVLGEEMAGPVHALALHLYSPEEWSGQSPDSPDCHGGSKAG